jgi:hypothetical protein
MKIRVRFENLWPENWNFRLGYYMVNWFGLTTVFVLTKDKEVQNALEFHFWLVNFKFSFIVRWKKI